MCNEFIEKNAQIFCGRKTWLEGAAVEQFKRVMSWEGVLQGAGFPDLHPGRGVPVGAAFLTQDVIYPALIGNDIGCGMTLFACCVSERKFKKDKLLRRLGDDLEIALKTAVQEELQRCGQLPDDPENMFGTLGHGNHFAEFLSVNKVLDQDVCQRMNLQKNDMLLLVHSGSRCYGEMLWREFAAIHGDSGVDAQSADGKDYLKRHADLIRWAACNRRLVGKALCNMANCESVEVLNSVHNSITEFGEGCFIHRKGAAAVEANMLSIAAGSRGSFSYLLMPQGNGIENIHSLAHGAGRKWNRQSTRDRVRAKHSNMQSLLQSKLGTAVLCSDKELLYEEAPEAYKDISQVLADLQQFNLAAAAAELKPCINIKP